MGDPRPPDSYGKEILMPKGYVSAVIDAPAESVWAIVRDFNGLPSWFPGCVGSHIEGDFRSDQIGCVRNFRMDDGVHVRERLTELRHEPPMWFAYDILDSPHRVDNYSARFRCLPITDNDTTFVDWEVTFDCRESSERDHYVRFFEQDVYMVGFRAIRDRLGQ